MFRDQEFTADLRSGPVKRILDVRMLKTHQFPEDAGPLAHPVRPASYIEINNFYTATVYEKGAELCRMLQTLLGRDGFRKGLDLYFERHDGEAATVEDFVAAMADVVGPRPLAVHALVHAGRHARARLLARLRRARQDRRSSRSTRSCRRPRARPRKEPMPIPLKLGLLGSNGDDLPLRARRRHASCRDGLVEVTEREQTFTFRDVPTRADPRRCCAASPRRSASPSASTRSRSSS